MAGPTRPLTIAEILRLADLHFMRFGEWPTSRTGKILDQPDRTWESVQTALAKGVCGLPGGDSLSRLLKRRRKAPNTRMTMPELTLKTVLEWADAHHARTGKWPRRDDGLVKECTDISWSTIDHRMKDGKLGVPKGTSLSKWLRQVRGSWDGGKRMLTRQIVLRWAQLHYNRFGRWPVTTSGPLHTNPSENWAAIDMALRNARRGISKQTSLSEILTEEFGERYTSSIGRNAGVARARRVIKISSRR